MEKAKAKAETGKVKARGKAAEKACATLFRKASARRDRNAVSAMAAAVKVAAAKVFATLSKKANAPKVQNAVLAMTAAKAMAAAKDSAKGARVAGPGKQPLKFVWPQPVASP